MYRLCSVLPWPVSALFSPFLVTPRDNGRVVFLVTDQIWIMDLAIFLNYCHSTQGSGSLLSPSSAIYLLVTIYDHSDRKLRSVQMWTRPHKVATQTDHDLPTLKAIQSDFVLKKEQAMVTVWWRRRQCVFSWCRGVIHVSLFSTVSLL